MYVTTSNQLMGIYASNYGVKFQFTAPAGSSAVSQPVRSPAVELTRTSSSQYGRHVHLGIDSSGDATLMVSAHNSVTGAGIVNTYTPQKGASCIFVAF